MDQLSLYRYYQSVYTQHLLQKLRAEQEEIKTIETQKNIPAPEKHERKRRSSNFSMASILGQNDSSEEHVVPSTSPPALSESTTVSPPAETTWVPGTIPKLPFYPMNIAQFWMGFNNQNQLRDKIDQKQPTSPTYNQHWKPVQIGQKTKRVRTIFTQSQIDQLEIHFQKSQYMIGEDRVRVAKELNLSETQV